MLAPINIVFSTLNIVTLVPMAMSICGALIILIIDFCSKEAKFDSAKSFYAMLCISFLLFDLIYLMHSGISPGEVQVGFFDFVLLDGIAFIAHLIIVTGSLLFVALSLTQKHFHEFVFPEFYALILFVVGGLQFMVATDNLILVFLGIETSSLALYTLIAMHNRLTAFEAAIKYFSMGALAASFFCFGAMMIYFATGEFQLAQIAERIANDQIASEVLLAVGILFVFAAIGFKVSLVPFHTWTPDVYEGASALMAGYLSIVPKIAAFVVAMRFFDLFLGDPDVVVDFGWLQALMSALIVVTITLPNLIALLQEDVKRMLAYSSISHAGFALATVMIHTPQAVQSLFLYWGMFLVTNLGAFGMLWLSRQKVNSWEGRYDHPYEKFSGLVQVMPATAVLIAIFMLSLAGIPPFALFWGKMYLISSALNAGHIILAVIMALNSAIAAYYYLKLIVYMFLRDVTDVTLKDCFVERASLPLKGLLVLAALAVCLSIFYVEDLMVLIGSYIG